MLQCNRKAEGHRKMGLKTKRLRIGLFCAAAQTVAALFAVPHSKKRKRYLDALEAGMDASSAAKVTQPTVSVYYWGLYVIL